MFNKESPIYKLTTCQIGKQEWRKNKGINNILMTQEALIMGPPKTIVNVWIK